jgi:hypothetical protein
VAYVPSLTYNLDLEDVPSSSSLLENNPDISLDTDNDDENPPLLVPPPYLSP